MNCSTSSSRPVRPTLCPLVPSSSGDDQGWESVGSSHIEADRQDVKRERPDDVIDIDEDLVCQPCDP